MYCGFEPIPASLSVAVAVTLILFVVLLAFAIVTVGAIVSCILNSFSFITVSPPFIPLAYTLSPCNKLGTALV